MFESYLPLPTLSLPYYFKRLVKNLPSSDTSGVHVKGIFGESNIYKSDIQALNTELSFVLWNELKEIRCTRNVFVSFCIEFLNYCNQLVWSWFQEFERKRCAYWIFYLTLLRLADVIFINNCLLLIWRIEIVGIEPLAADKILRK